MGKRKNIHIKIENRLQCKLTTMADEVNDIINQLSPAVKDYVINNKSKNKDIIIDAIEIGIRCIMNTQTNSFKGADKASSETPLIDTPQNCALVTKIKQEKTPWRLGKEGEDYVQKILESKYNVKNVSKTEKSCDLKVEIDSKVILLEIKNHSNPVPSTEIKKFIRDIEINKPNAGIFISKSSISCIKTPKIEIVYMNSQPIVLLYLSTFNKDSILLSIEFINSMLNALGEKDLNLDIIMDHVKNIKEGLGVLSKTDNEYSNMILDINSKMIKQRSDISKAESIIRYNCNKIHNHIIKPTTNTNLLLELNEIKIIEPTRIAIVNIYNKLYNSGKCNNWQRIDKKIVNIDTGIYITLGKHNAKITIDRKYIDSNEYNYLISKNATVGKNVTMEINMENELIITNTLNYTFSAPECGKT